MTNEINNLTGMLNQWMEGDISIENDLMNEIYPLLKDIAHKQLTKSYNSSFQTTVVINELYLKFKKQKSIKLNNKSHFLAVTTKLIRNIIIDEFRNNNSLKRGQHYDFITLHDNEVDSSHHTKPINVDWLTLHHLLEELESIDPESVRLIELRFFVGLSIPETAEVLNTSPSSIARNWKFAKSWLFNRLKNDSD